MGAVVVVESGSQSTIIEAQGGTGAEVEVNVLGSSAAVQVSALTGPPGQQGPPGGEVVLTTDPIEVTRNDTTLEVELTQVGSKPLGSLTFLTLGSSLQLQDRVTGAVLVPWRVFSLWADSDGVPFPSFSAANDYIAAASALPPETDLVAVFETALAD